MADKPQRWTANPTDEVYGEKLLLPSFRVSVSRSAPTAVAIPTGWGHGDFSVDSGDAFSVSYLRESSNVSTANHDFARLDPGYLRKILLYILFEEEYKWIEEHHAQRNLRDLQRLGTDLLEDLQHPLSGSEKAQSEDAGAQVRLTDLRLTKDIKPAHLRRELRSAMPGLRLPLTTESVLEWKWETLRKPKGLKTRVDLTKNDEWYEEEQIRVKVVSFAAAALLLLVDLGTRHLEEATHNTLVGHVEELFRIIQELIDKLDGSANELLKLLAGRKGTKGGHPPDPDVRCYVALSLYRMGRCAQEIAQRVGVLPTDRRDNSTKPPKNWKSNLRKLVKRGVEVEKVNLPRAAAVFARKNERQVRAKAIAEYRLYLEKENWEEVGEYISSAGIGDDLLSGGIPVEEKDEVYRAFVQLGSCLENDIDPLPETTTSIQLTS